MDDHDNFDDFPIEDPEADPDYLFILRRDGSANIVGYEISKDLVKTVILLPLFQRGPRRYEPAWPWGELH